MKRILQLLLISSMLVNMGISYGQEYSMAFDSAVANGQYVTIPAISDVQGTAARTVEMWIKAETGQAVQAQFIQWGVDASGEKFAIRMDGDASFALRLEHGGGAHVGSTPLNDNVWHHIAITVPADGTMADSKLYVDGNLETASNTPNDVAFNTGDSDIKLCRTAYSTVNPNPNPYRRYNGLIDELRIWKKELSADEVAELKDSVICPENYDDLVAYFRFNEGTDTIVFDETGTYSGYLGGGDGITDEYATWGEGKSGLDESECVVSSSSIDYEKKFHIYPNPVIDKIKIDCEEQIEVAEVYNLLGKKVLTVESPKQNTFNMSSLQIGIYMLRLYINENEEIGTIKIIKK